MTQEIRIRTSDEVEPDDSPFDGHTTIGPQQPLSHDEIEGEYRGRYRFEDTEPVDELHQAAKNIVDGFELATVEYRHTWREYSGEEFLNDASYYPPTGYTGLRAPPVVSHQGVFELGVEAEFAVGGGEFNAAGSVEIAPPADYARRDLIVASKDGLQIITGESFGRPSEGGVINTPTAGDEEVAIALGTVKEPVDGIPSSGIDVQDAVGEASDWETVINR